MLVKNVVKTIRCSDGSEKWFYSDGTSEVKDPEWLAYAERARKKEQKLWRQMTEKVHLTTGKTVA